MVADEGALVPKEDAQMGEIEKQVLLVNCLKSASMSISILGNLNLIAAAAPDFKLTREDAEIELEHLKYPESFRASLSQVSNMGHRAFLEAQNAMDVIVLRTSNVPSIVNETYEILTEGEDEDLKDIPTNLAAIKRNVDKCTEAADGVVTIFKDVQNTIAELAEVSHSKKGEVEQKREETINERTDKEMEEEAREENQRKLEEMVKNLKEKADKQEAKADAAIEELGSFGSIMKQLFASAGEALIKVIPTVASAAMGPLGVASGAMSNVKTMANGSANAGGTASAPKQSNMVGANDCIELKLDLEVLMRKIAKTSNLFEENGKMLPEEVWPDQTAINDKKQEMEELKARITEHQEENEGMAADMLELCGKTITFLGMEDSEKQPQAQYFVGEVARISKQMYPVLIEQSSSDASGGGENSGGIASQFAQGQQAKAQLLKAKLEVTQGELEKYRDKELDNRLAMQKLLRDIEQLNLEEATQEKVIDALKDALKELAKLQEHWGKILAFFQDLANILHHKVGENFVEFDAKANSALETRNGGRQVSRLKKRHLTRPAVEALKWTMLVHGSAFFYAETSKKHFLPLLENLGNLLALDAETDKCKMKEFQKELSTKAEQATSYIGERSEQLLEELGEQLNELTTSEGLQALTLET